MKILSETFLSNKCKIDESSFNLERNYISCDLKVWGSINITIEVFKEELLIAKYLCFTRKQFEVNKDKALTIKGWENIKITERKPV